MKLRTVLAPTAALIMLAGTSPALAAEDVSKTLTDLETKWMKASMAGDAATVGAILAQDWTGQDPSGSRIDRSGFMTTIMPNIKIATAVNHDVHVHQLGDIAIVQGMDDEKSSYKGKDTSGTYSWTDVFQKRNGTWVAVASQITKVMK